MRSWSGFGRRRSRKSHVWHKTFGTRRWSLFERLASNDDIGVDIDIVSFASRLRCPYMLFFDVRLSLALNIWLSVNRTQLEGLYKFVIIGSHLALWDSPDKPAQTSYFLSNPLLSFHQPFYTSLLAHQHLLGYFWILAMLVMACLWWCDGGGDGTFAGDLWFDTTADLCTLAPLCWGKQRQETAIFVDFLPQCSDDQLMRMFWGKCS